MEFALLFQPVLHGALGWWDEIINLIPLAIGVLLLLYLYRSSRQARHNASQEPAEGEAQAPEPK